MLYIFIFLISFSCKKDKLEGDKSALVGKWDWITTNHNYGFCYNDSQTETITPESEGSKYSMEFLEKGILKYYENDDYLGKDRIKSSIVINSLETVDFELNLSTKDRMLSGLIRDDTMLIVRGFPFENTEEGCEVYASYFVRQ